MTVSFMWWLLCLVAVVIGVLLYLYFSLRIERTFQVSGLRTTIDQEQEVRNELFDSLSQELGKVRGLEYIIQLLVKYPQEFDARFSTDELATWLVLYDQDIWEARKILEKRLIREEPVKEGLEEDVDAPPR